MTTLLFLLFAAIAGYLIIQYVKNLHSTPDYKVTVTPKDKEPEPMEWRYTAEVATIQPEPSPVKRAAKRPKAPAKKAAPKKTPAKKRPTKQASKRGK